MEESFGAELRRLRLAAGLTQERLAELAGLSEQAVGTLERGNRKYPYRDTVTRLADALGLAEVARSALLAAARRPGRPRPATVPMDDNPARDWVIPHQLPAVPSDFSGRAPELAQIRAALTGPLSQVPGATRVITIQGMAGTGKSVLATTAAAGVADHFPDGELYLDLGGFGQGTPIGVDQAVHGLLRATGVADADIPGPTDEACSLFRTRLTGRRVLVLLDNAAGVEQLTPLVPAAPSCATIAISRISLTTLPAGCHVQLGGLSERDGVDLLRSIAGPMRIDAEPEAAAAVVESCGYLPLAIRIAAGRLVARPTWTLEHLAERLGRMESRIDELDAGATGVRASLSLSIGRRFDDVASAGQVPTRTFASLGLVDAPELSTVAAAQLMDTSRPVAESVLEQMVDAHVLSSPAPGRYRIHDLLHLYARELAGSVLPPHAQDGALDRLLGFYEAAAWHATKLIAPRSPRLVWARTDLPAADLGLPDAPAALRWLTSEHVSVVRLATQLSTHLSTASIDRSRGISDLAIGLASYFIACGRSIDHMTLVNQALAISSDDSVNAMLHCDLGIAQAEQRQHEDALDSFGYGATAFRAVGNQRGEALALNNASRLLGSLGRFDDAILRGERSLELNLEVGDPFGTALALTNLGTFHCGQGVLEKGFDYFNRSLRVCEDSDNTTGRALALHNLGCVHLDLGRPEAAVESLARAVELTRQTGMRTSLCNVLHDLAAAYRRVGKHRAALSCAQEAFEIASAADDDVRRARANLQLGELLTDLADHRAAGRSLRQALQFYARHDQQEADRIRRLLADNQ
ncbi:tetratricopeptide repeat protein [Kribbella sp. NPDC055110]